MKKTTKFFMSLLFAGLMATGFSVEYENLQIHSFSTDGMILSPRDA